MKCSECPKEKCTECGSTICEGYCTNHLCSVQDAMAPLADEYMCSDADKDEVSYKKFYDEHSFRIMQYDSLRKHFKKMVDNVLGKDYYNLGSDVYERDRLICEDITDLHKRSWLSKLIPSFCKHKWEHFHTITITDWNEQPTGTKYILQCKNCGDIKKRTV